MSFTILKLSGFVLDSDEQIALIPKMVKKLTVNNSHLIIVHGAGKQVDRACEERSIPIKKIAGRRITSEPIINLMLELVHGKLNRNIVQKLIERLPIMICPAWTKTRSQPVALFDVIKSTPI